jgi:ribosome-associated protein
VNLDTFYSELTFQTARSSGPGGQHVNKTETKVAVSWHIENSNAITASQKATLLYKLSNKINADGTIQLTEQSDRSQLRNKELVKRKLVALIEKALTPTVKRLPTHIPKGVVAARKKAKAIRGEVKSLRQKPSLDQED